MKHTKIRSYFKGYLYIVFAALLWGTIPIISRFLYEKGSNPITAAAIRSYFSALFFVIISVVTKSYRKIKIREIPFYFIYGLVGIGGTFFFYMKAVQLLPTFIAALLLYTGPSFVILFNRIIFKIKITIVKIIAVILTVIGCILVLLGGNIKFHGLNIQGVLFGIFSGICYSMVTVLGRIAVKKHDSETNVGLMMIFGSFLFLFFVPPWKLPTVNQDLVIGYIALILLTGVGGYGAYLKGLSYEIENNTAGIIATLEPVSATLFGVYMLNESITSLQLIGIILVICGVIASVTLTIK